MRARVPFYPIPAYCCTQHPPTCYTGLLLYTIPTYVHVSLFFPIPACCCTQHLLAVVHFARLPLSTIPIYLSTCSCPFFPYTRLMLYTPPAYVYVPFKNITHILERAPFLCYTRLLLYTIPTYCCEQHPPTCTRPFLFMYPPTVLRNARLLL